MPSLIDPTLPVDFAPASKADLRRNFAAAKAEIEALQAFGGSGIAALTVNANRRLLLSDAGNKFLCVDSSNEVKLSIPINSVVPFPIGSLITIVRWGIGLATIVAETGVSLRVHPGHRATIQGQYQLASLWQKSLNTWLIYGTLASALASNPK